MKETSQVQQVYAPVERVYTTLSNFDNLRPVIERMKTDENLKQKLQEAGHAEAIDQLAQIELNQDSVSIPAPMIGNISLQIIEREENKCIKIQTTKSPIAATLWIQVLPVSEYTSKLRLTIDADIPFMLKAIIGSKVKDGIEKLAEGLARIPY